MSDTDCRDEFRFDHAGIKRVVVFLRISAVLITPKHGERFSALKDQLGVWSVIDVKKVATADEVITNKPTSADPKNLVVQCCQCEDGLRGDGYILRASNFLPFLDGHADIQQNQHLVFGVSAYLNNNVVTTMFRGRNLLPWASAFNKRMTKVSVSVEWRYAQVAQNFAVLDWKQSKRCLSKPSG
ncbi:hypothetical protein GQ600_8981 [Phytophthora cactorum]|nr:hypothetical protein GQ600_8981 [Phytophthora cactorum]